MCLTNLSAEGTFFSANLEKCASQAHFSPDERHIFLGEKCAEKCAFGGGLQTNRQFVGAVEGMNRYKFFGCSITNPLDQTGIKYHGLHVSEMPLTNKESYLLVTLSNCLTECFTPTRPQFFCFTPTRPQLSRESNIRSA